jgi:glycolate oxidase FAD binding subunit
VLLGLDDDAAVRLLTSALGTPYEIAGAAHLPAAVVARSSVPAIAQSGGSATLIRLEGFGPSVADRYTTLEGRFSRDHAYLALDAEECTAVWREVREVAPLVDAQAVVWRLSLRATDAARVARGILGVTGGEAFYDWGGGLLWLALPVQATDGHAAQVRGALSSGHATLMRAPVETRATTAIFQPRPPALAALEGRVKAAFDPHTILSPHFMTQGS